MEKSMEKSTPATGEKSPQGKMPKISKKVLAAALVVALLAGGAYYFKGQFIVATVNGSPVFRLTLINELEKQSGEGTLQALVTKKLVLQEAKNLGVSVSDDEVNQEVSKIEENIGAQGQSLDQVLGMQGITREDLKEQIKIQKIAEQIAGKDVEVTDQEVEDYFKENQDSFPEDASEEELKESIRQRLEQQKLSEAINSWVESLRNSATINYFKDF